MRLSLWLQAAKSNGEGVWKGAGMVKKVMQAGEKVLLEELELQYDIDNGIYSDGILGPQIVPVTPVSSASISPAAKKARTTPAPHSECSRRTWDSDDEDMGINDADEERDDSGSEAANSSNPNNVECYKTERNRAVADALNAWLNRKNHPSDPDNTMVGYWAAQPDGMMRRVARRAGAFMVAQVETERVNKLPKQMYKKERMKLLHRNVTRDVFLRCNKERLPRPRLDFRKLKTPPDENLEATMLSATLVAFFLVFFGLS